jgi:uncharacterized protein (DUF58 family)
MTPAFSLSAALLRECHTRARARAGMFRLPLRRKVWRGGTGDFMGRGTGASLDFQDHRAYVPGDDPRHLNWQAYARTGQYSMKLFREEVRPLIDVVLDVSPSMFFTEEKAVRSAELFYFAVEGALRAGATPLVTAVCGSWRSALPQEAVMSHRWAEQLPAGPHSAAAPPDLARVPLRAQSLRIVVSDLLFAGDPQPFASALTVRQGRALVFAPFCQAETDPDWDGNMEFIEAEARSHHPRRVEPALLRRYRAAYGRHFDLWKAAAQRYGVTLARVPCAPDLSAALQLEALRNGAVEPWA